MAWGNFWGELVSKLRQEQKMSQRTLAVLAKVNRATLRRIEAGATPSDVDVLERLLSCLGYELEALKLDGKRRVYSWDGNLSPERKSKLAALIVLSMDLS